MNHNDDHFTKLGTFFVSPTKKVAGELSCAGDESYLYLGDDNDFDIFASRPYITGYLHDLTKVTLIDCLVKEGTGKSSNQQGEVFHQARYFPHYVITGNSYIAADDEIIHGISFEIEDAHSLFYDFGVFSSHLGNPDLISEIVKLQKIPYDISIGEHPIVAYFTGKIEIIKVGTALGDIVVNHNPNFDTGSTTGVHINNSIRISIRSSAPIVFDAAIKQTLDLLRFINMVIGRNQMLSNIKINISDDENTPNYLSVYWSLSSGHVQKSKQNSRKPHPSDVLVDPINRPEEFSAVLINWLLKNEDRREARFRFSNSFNRGNVYDIDRLVGAANMFDILPCSAVPKPVELSDELIDAKDQCCTLFKALPDSPERSSILGALGRLGHSALKHKIHHRAKYIINADKEKFQHLHLVIDEAVNCRNHYVHGSKSKIDYSKNPELTWFYVDTLEFIFAISELIECGWDMQFWVAKGRALSHPFGFYLEQYPNKIRELKKVLTSL